VNGVLPAADLCSTEELDDEAFWKHKDDPNWKYLSIDTSGLLGMNHQPEPVLADQSHKSKKTPMVEELRQQIKVRGALSVNDWMYQCLQNQKYGYYTTKHAQSVIGGKGGESAADSTSGSSTAAASAESAAASDAAPASASEQPAAADAGTAASASASVSLGSAAEQQGGDFITSPELGQIFGEVSPTTAAAAAAADVYCLDKLVSPRRLT